jgi:DNA mismatch endonuclease, patch repair protein
VGQLPGRPDIVLPKYRAIIFVHGCFWHMHKCGYGKVVPNTNREFWQNKRLSNVERDRRNRRKLRSQWSVLTVWECETRNQARLSNKLQKFFGKVTVS